MYICSFNLILNMFKFFTFSLIFFLSGLNIIKAQETDSEFTPHGSPIIKVYSYFRYDFTEDAQQTSRFDISRAYLGYKHYFSKNLTGKVIYAVAHTTPVSGVSAYTGILRNAQLDWQISSKFKFSGGLISTTQHQHQESFWGHRYVYKSFQDENSFGASVDFGANLQIKAISNTEIDIFVHNGYGNKKMQDEFGTYRFGSTIINKSVKGLILKAHLGMMPEKYKDGTVIKDTSTITNLSFFAGYELPKVFKIGAEYDLMQNGITYSQYAEDYEKSGFSVFASYFINDKVDIFARFDRLTSNQLDGAAEAWNYTNDNDFIIGGIQYAPVKGILTSVNYRTNIYVDSNRTDLSMIYINLQYAF